MEKQADRPAEARLSPLAAPRRYAGLEREGLKRTAFATVPANELTNLRRLSSRSGDACTGTEEKLMKSIQHAEYVGPEIVRVVEIAEPHAGPGQVRVAVQAATARSQDARS